VSACLLLLCWSWGTGASPGDRFRRQQTTFQNFPAIPQQQPPSNDFNSARYQTQFSSGSSRQFSSAQQLTARNPPPISQQDLGLPAPGSGKSLFDQIVKRINSGHRENARREQSKVGQDSLVIGMMRLLDTY